MAGSGRVPKEEGQRRNRHELRRGDWTPASGVGWQHGAIPAAPAELTKAARDAWDVWMRAWFAAHWTPDDLPGLRQLVRLYDQVERGEFQRHNELRLSMDTYGITPKGQQDRRWKRPVAEDEASPASVAAKARATSRRRDLKVV